MSLRTQIKELSPDEWARVTKAAAERSVRAAKRLGRDIDKSVEDLADASVEDLAKRRRQQLEGLSEAAGSPSKHMSIDPDLVPIAAVGALSAGALSAGAISKLLEWVTDGSESPTSSTPDVAVDDQDVHDATRVLRELSNDDLHDRLRESKEELFHLKFDLATGQLDNNRRLRTVRRDIARTYTVMRERELALGETFEASNEELGTRPRPV